MAKIIGNTTATPNPRPDWEQADPTKADYIKNKPEIPSLEGLATEIYVDKKIGDIETALNNIIDMQNFYINGGEA